MNYFTGLQRALGLESYHTTWEWLHKLRRAMARSDRDRLSGVVEMDETFIGGEHSGKCGRRTEGKTLVLIAVEKTQKGRGRIRLTPIKDGSGKILKETTLRIVEPGSTIYTDSWDAFNLLANGHHAPLIYAHSISGDAIPHTHHVAALLKRWGLETDQGATSSEHLAYYLDEFTFRFNRRTSRSRGKLFLSLNFNRPCKLIQSQLKIFEHQGERMSTA